MSTIMITHNNAQQWVTYLLNLDISALQTQEMARCREPIWELRHIPFHQTLNRLDRRLESPNCLLYCIERLFNCLSEEAKATVQQQITQGAIITRKNSHDGQ